MKRGGPLKRTSQLKRGGRLRQQSTKTARIEREAAKVRREWKAEAGCCMACGYRLRLVGHEISNGPLRRQSLDKPFCVLIICRRCNEGPFMDKSIWPEARQLCLLMVRARERYDLAAYLNHTNPRAPIRITQADVDAYRESVA